MKFLRSSKKNKFLSIIKLSRQAFGKYKLQIFFLIILGFVTGLLEGIGVTAAIPLISLATEEGLREGGIISQLFKQVFSYFNSGSAIEKHGKGLSF